MVKGRQAKYNEALVEIMKPPLRRPWTNFNAVFVLMETRNDFTAVQAWLDSEIGEPGYITMERPVTFWVMLRRDDDALAFKMRWC